MKIVDVSDSIVSSSSVFSCSSLFANRPGSAIIYTHSKQKLIDPIVLSFHLSNPSASTLIEQYHHILHRALATILLRLSMQPNPSVSLQPITRPPSPSSPYLTTQIQPSNRHHSAPTEKTEHLSKTACRRKRLAPPVGLHPALGSYLFIQARHQPRKPQNKTKEPQPKRSEAEVQTNEKRETRNKERETSNRLMDRKMGTVTLQPKRRNYVGGLRHRA